MKSGLMLLNLGTPDSTQTSDVRRYLEEFLSDPYVIDIAPLARWLLVHIAILPFRPKKSAHAYKQIWTERGSPLRFHTKDLAEGVAKQLEKEGVLVEWAMRYGNPTIESAIRSLSEKSVTKITVLPLYPQYALSSTETGLAKVRELKKAYPHIHFDWIQPFYAEKAFIDPLAEVSRSKLRNFKADHVLMSFHGLPERHVKKTDSSEGKNHCLQSSDCCNKIDHRNKNCYRAQCFATARELAESLNLRPDQYSVSFQSRLGRTPWIQPFTDLVIPELVQRGVKRLAVVCPSFVSDCLETLEEIGMRAREAFLEAGGEDFELISCVNADPSWQRGVVDLYKQSHLRALL